MRRLSLLLFFLPWVGAGGGRVKAQNLWRRPKKNETVFERVMRTKTLRCGYMGLAFNHANGDTLRNIAVDPPLRIFPIYLTVPKGEFELQTLLQSMLNLMRSDQALEGIIKRYEKYPGSFYRVAKPYEVPKQ